MKRNLGKLFASTHWPVVEGCNTNCHFMWMKSLHQSCYVLMTCQKFCSVSGGNLIKHIFSSRSREGISFFIIMPPPCLPGFLHFWEDNLFFIMPPSCFALVSPVNFWQVSMWGKAPSQGHYPIGPALHYHLMHPYFGNVLDIGLYPTHFCLFQLA